MKNHLFRIFIATFVAVTLPLSPIYAAIAEISHNFTDYVHLDGLQEDEEMGPSAALDSLDALIQEFLTDEGASEYFLSISEEEDDDDDLAGAAWWTNRNFLIASGLLLSTGLVLGLLALLMGNGGSSSGEAAGAGASPSSSPQNNQPDNNLPNNPGAPISNLSEPPTDPTENTNPDSNDDPNLAGGGPPPGSGEPGDPLLNELSDFPGGNPNENLSPFIETSGGEEGSGGSGSRRLPHSPEPSTILLSLMGLSFSMLRRRKKS